MKYRVVDNPFNRANYAHMIGQILDKPPAYAVVETISDGSPTVDPDDLVEHGERWDGQG